ncbi:MAG: DUF4128 domain-containing protein [Chitinispirillales bacterium]|jgi:hypothetical protein|nr:DUF4128 domain-containing protein [Chitinispirillales bacterium]
MALKIHRAIADSLEKAGFGLEIAWPNILYKPCEHLDDQGEPLPFLELVYGASNRTQFTLDGDEGVDRVNGLFMVNVRYATNRGAVLAENKAHLILYYYLNGGEFAYDGQIVRVIGASLEPGAPDFGWYKITVAIRYESYQRRT